MRIQECKNKIREYTQYQCHRSHMGRGPQLFKMGTWFWVKWGPKGGFRQQKKGTKKCVYLINWLKRANSLKEGKHFLWQILTWILFKMYFQPVLTNWHILVWPIYSMLFKMVSVWVSKTDGISWGREGRVIYLGTAAIDEIEMWPKSSSMVCSMVEVWYGRNPE